MKYFIRITALLLFVSLFAISCHKQVKNQNTIDYLKNNAILEKVGVQTDNGLVGDMYSNNEQQIILLNEIQTKTDHDNLTPTGTFRIGWTATEFGPRDFHFYCDGTPIDCTDT